MELKVGGKLSARDVCVLCWHASQAGIQGPAQELKFRPDAPTGHYQRHIDVVTQATSSVEGVYTLTVPAHDKHSLTRTSLDLPS
eukprot:10280441-Alexandrium_andersonii.AAC.1